MRIITIAAAAATALGLTAPAHAAQGMGGCQLNGTAKFAQPLKVNQPTPGPGGIDWGAPFDYTFSGQLTNCTLVSLGGLSQGERATIAAGEPITYKGRVYEWPFAKPKGEGGCSGSHTEGTAVVVWADDTISTISYETEGAAAAVGLTGSFGTAKVTLQSVEKDATGKPVSTVTPALRFAGDSTGGPLAFQPPDPTACNGAGVATAGISGYIGRGNPS